MVQDPENEKQKSLTNAIEQIAKLLRTEVKEPPKAHVKKRTTVQLSAASGIGAANVIEQVAKMMRTEIQISTSKKKKKRSWSHTRTSSKKKR